MKHPKNRAERRHNRQVKIDRVAAWHTYTSLDAVDVRRYATTPAMCSCDLCSKNRRRDAREEDAW